MSFGPGRRIPTALPHLLAPLTLRHSRFWRTPSSYKAWYRDRRGRLCECLDWWSRRHRERSASVRQSPPASSCRQRRGHPCDCERGRARPPFRQSERASDSEAMDAAPAAQRHHWKTHHFGFAVERPAKASHLEAPADWWKPYCLHPWWEYSIPMTWCLRCREWQYSWSLSHDPDFERRSGHTSWKPSPSITA